LKGVIFLIIHVVKPGDTLSSIGRTYGTSVTKIASDNELNTALPLVVGQTIVILQGNRRHTVQRGQSIYSIAGIYGVRASDILAANPQIRNPSQLQVGQIITIPSRTTKLGTIEVNGYALPNIDMEVLRKTLPHLTYLSIFSNEVNRDGTIREINDAPLISAARAARVAPLFVISNIEQGGSFSSDLARAILRSEAVQDRLIANIINTMRRKNYYGLDIDFEYIYPEDREYYNRFLRKVVNRLKPLGYSVSTALAPKTSAELQGLLYTAHDYPVHGQLVDHTILMTYEWGHTYGPPMAVAPIDQVKKVLDYAVTAIPRQKILMGMPNYGYDWTLPYQQGRAAKTVSNVGAVDLARRYKQAISYDAKSQTPFFNYFDENRVQHVVWFEDARSISVKLRTAKDYNLGGVSYWTIGRYFPQNWLVQNALYNVRKLL
jgi:spore germination protein